MPLTLYTGDDRIYTFVVYLNGSPLSLVGVLGIKFLVKRGVDDADAAALITKTLGTGIVVTIPLSGTGTITFTAADSVLFASETVVCAMKIKDWLGLTHTVYANTFDIVRPAVRAV